jgi:hypothetical protein
MQASNAPAASPEWRYFLKGGKIMWVPPIIHDAIQDTSKPLMRRLRHPALQRRRKAGLVEWKLDSFACHWFCLFLGAGRLGAC